MLINHRKIVSRSNRIKISYWKKQARKANDMHGHERAVTSTEEMRRRWWCDDTRFRRDWSAKTTTRNGSRESRERRAWVTKLTWRPNKQPILNAIILSGAGSWRYEAQQIFAVHRCYATLLQATGEREKQRNRRDFGRMWFS